MSLSITNNNNVTDNNNVTTTPIMTPDNNTNDHPPYDDPHYYYDDTDDEFNIIQLYIIAILPRIAAFISFSCMCYMIYTTYLNKHKNTYHRSII